MYMYITAVQLSNKLSSRDPKWQYMKNRVKCKSFKIDHSNFKDIIVANFSVRILSQEFERKDALHVYVYLFLHSECARTWL